MFYSLIRTMRRRARDFAQVDLLRRELRFVSYTEKTRSTLQDGQASGMGRVSPH